MSPGGPPAVVPVTANPFPDGSPVEVPFPLTPEQEDGPRDAWPWLPGTVRSRCGPDEWDVMIGARELATLEDGSPAPDGTPKDELCYPCVFRDAGEIRAPEKVE